MVRTHTNIHTKQLEQTKDFALNTHTQKKKNKQTDMRCLFSVFVFERSSHDRVCSAVIISAVLRSCMQIYTRHTSCVVVEECVTIHPSCHYHLLILFFQKCIPSCTPTHPPQTRGNTHSYFFYLTVFHTVRSLCHSCLSFTSGLFGTIFPKHCWRRPENESSFSLHFSEISFSCNS